VITYLWQFRPSEKKKWTGCEKPVLYPTHVSFKLYPNSQRSGHKWHALEFLFTMWYFYRKQIQASVEVQHGNFKHTDGQKLKSYHALRCPICRHLITNLPTSCAGRNIMSLQPRPQQLKLAVKCSVAKYRTSAPCTTPSPPTNGVTSPVILRSLRVSQVEVNRNWKRS
jgi:hypothetical protein